MDGVSHIGQFLKSLRATRGKERVTICEGRVQNGAQFVDQIAALSLGLRQLGLRPGERVAIAALNSEWYLEWLLAVPSAGGIIAPLNHRWSVEEAAEAVREIGAKVLVLDDYCMSWSSALRASCPSLTWIVCIGTFQGRARQSVNNSQGLKRDSCIETESLILLAGPEPELQLLQEPHSIALICFTSGTTGRPKGVSLSHKALIVQSLAKISVVGYSVKDAYLHTTPLCHIGGISSALATVMTNGCHVILPKFHSLAVFEAIDEHKVTTMILVPAMINDLISYWARLTRIGDEPGGNLRVFPTVETILNGAGSLSLSQVEAVKKIFPSSKIMSAYGMTEAASTITFLRFDDVTQPSLGPVPDPSVEQQLVGELPQESTAFHLGGVCVGTPPPHVEICIQFHQQQQHDKRSDVRLNITTSSSSIPLTTKGSGSDTAVLLGISAANRSTISSSNSSSSLELLSGHDRTRGKELPLLSAGTVLTRGAHVMNGYWGRPEQTEQVLHSDGWLDTGDVGWMDEFGKLWLLGRKKDVIKSGGENVYATEVEGVLMKHPAVSAVAAVGVPDARLGEAVAAMVQIRQEWRWDYSENTKEGLLERVITENLLRAHCRQLGLSPYKIPRFVEVDEGPFPMTSTGKVKKDEVRLLLIAQLEKRHAGRKSVLSDSKSEIKTAGNQKFIRSRL